MYGTMGMAGSIGLLLLIPVYIFAMIAQIQVKSTFTKFTRVGSYRKMTGVEVARAILDRNGLNHIVLEPVAGTLTDHYDPKHDRIRLSQPVYNSDSIAAISVAAHEVGHALQYAQGYQPIRLRNTFLPLANIGSKMLPLLILAGFFFRIVPLVDLGILFYLFAVLFHIVTLPIEFNASSRAIAELVDGHYILEEEISASKKVLGAAARTYVASAAVSIMELVRLLLIRDRMSRNN
jgi:Zn-dependent membrane protease YugP